MTNEQFYILIAVPLLGILLNTFWIGRCHRKKAQYDEALAFTLEGKRIAVAEG